MMHEIKIRRLVYEDLDVAFDLRLESVKNSPTSFIVSCAEEESTGKDSLAHLLQLNSNNNLIFGAFIENVLVGIVGIYKKNFVKIKHKSYVWGMYVKPSYRKLSVGKSLMQTVIHYTKHEMQCSLICLSVIANNLPALKLYESCGFKVWGREKSSLYVDDQFYDEYHASLMLD